MKLKLLKACVVAGHPGLKPGDVFETKDSLAVDLVSGGLAEGVESELRNPKDEQIQTREPIAETRDPKVGRRFRPGQQV